jgi:hypothetical protein
MVETDGDRVSKRRGVVIVYANRSNQLKIRQIFMEYLDTNRTVHDRLRIVFDDRIGLLQPGNDPTLEDVAYVVCDVANARYAHSS